MDNDQSYPMLKKLEKYKTLFETDDYDTFYEYLKEKKLDDEYVPVEQEPIVLCISGTLEPDINHNGEYYVFREVVKKQDNYFYTITMYLDLCTGSATSQVYVVKKDTDNPEPTILTRRWKFFDVCNNYIIVQKTGERYEADETLFCKDGSTGEGDDMYYKCTFDKLRVLKK